MNTTIIVSNRLPFSISIDEDNYKLTPSIGGLATGLSSIMKQPNTLWFGWLGVAEETIPGHLQLDIEKDLLEKRTKHVPLTQRQIDLFYHGYANTTLWPLCHYFVDKTKQDDEQWRVYQEVNAWYYQKIKPHLNSKTTVWIHDYQLMLLPAMIRRDFPSIKIGYFHHIPFPSFELFRLLTTKEELLKGLLGADLIGFHTYDYVRHFLSSVARILRLNRHLYTIDYGYRKIMVDAFPMGIDYKSFSVVEKVENPLNGNSKIILAVDRLDYTKGIVERLKGFQLFLELYPQYHHTLQLKLIVAPSRDVMDSYEALKETIEKLVSHINGKFGTHEWMPVWYLYQSFPQSMLKKHYQQADVMLVTPLRDGMNLVAKEYLAARQDGLGMLVLSETAGASGELAEALLVNPTNPLAIAQAIQEALIMPRQTKIIKNKLMRERLRRYDVQTWVKTFMNRLMTLPVPNNYREEVSFQTVETTWIKKIRDAQSTLIILDYDGTISEIQSNPDLAVPSAHLIKLIKKLSQLSQLDLAIVSGRDFNELSRWFKKIPIHLSGNHGAHLQLKGESVQTLGQPSMTWKHAFKPMLYRFVDQMPGSFLEEKSYSLVFHYRQCDVDMVGLRLGEIIDALESIKGKSPLQILQGHKVIEIKDATVDKGQVAYRMSQLKEYDHILVFGDDRTDELMFEKLPHAVTIKVGGGPTSARYKIDQPSSVIRFLMNLLESLQ
jgi:trehalose 6-phosphate synthase/phosphatase